MGGTVDESVGHGDKELGAFQEVRGGERLLGEGPVAGVAAVARDAAAGGSQVGAVVLVEEASRIGLSVLEAGSMGAERRCEAPLDFERLNRPVHARGSSRPRAEAMGRKKAKKPQARTAMRSPVGSTTCP